MNQWKTFEGKVIDLEEMDHQHLSNIYWYHTIILGECPYQVMEVLNRRFNDEILEYRPLPRFKSEVNFLVRNNMLKPSPHPFIKEVWFDGKKIGKIVYKDEL